MVGRVIGFFCIAILLWYTLQLGLVRYFDADELAYLHWAHNVFIGSRPYYDFYFYVPSGFLYVLAPLFIFVQGADILTVSRIFAFVVQVGIVVSLIAVYKRWRGSWFGLLAAIVFLFLPLPKDKFLEVRPDNLVMFVGLIAMICQIGWMEKNTKNLAFWAGIYYGLSLIILPKIMPQIIVACLVALFFRRHLGTFVIGLVVPLVGFFLFQVGIAKNMGEISTLWYSLTTLPFEVNKIAQQFPMQPDLFFYPNSTYYGVGGWSLGLIANHGIWIIGLLMGSVGLVTSYRPKDFLISGTMFLYILTFMYGYPLRHAQYLIPIAVFVSLYVADGVEHVWNHVKAHAIYRGLFLGLCVVSVFFGWRIFLTVHVPKLSWTNAEDRRIITKSQSLISKNAYVLDLIGATIYFRDPYYVCCLPYGQHVPYLSRPLPVFDASLVGKDVKFYYEGRLNRLRTIPSSAQEYIHYHGIVKLE